MTLFDFLSGAITLGFLVAGLTPVMLGAGTTVQAVDTGSEFDAAELSDVLRLALDHLAPMRHDAALAEESRRRFRADPRPNEDRPPGLASH